MALISYLIYIFTEITIAVQEVCNVKFHGDIWLCKRRYLFVIGDWIAINGHKDIIRILREDSFTDEIIDFYYIFKPVSQACVPLWHRFFGRQKDFCYHCYAVLPHYGVWGELEMSATFTNASQSIISTTERDKSE